ncbi:methyltransferase [Arthroderma uncinatum]|uniref:methyltransferase n=1 Tax=Arthroderma uncinatum TaxID=74035 RepID=UPI00144AAC44|nr:methyltransferase [Arthroderma uncinatum]KAF3491240.1 methyltransferase [Arthroderma uncinatum]
MGKKRNFKKKGGSKGGSRSTRPANYSTILVRENENYEKYYNSLQIVPEDEKQQFWDAMRRDLPNSFRFTGSRSHALALQKQLKDFYIPNITSIRYEGELVEPPRPVPWYPEQLAWSMTTPKSVVRRFAPFSSFQKFLVSETEVGNISRQEVVSMIPPLLLDVRPGMVVLDMCAAPGSKSAQLMEMIHAGEEERMAKIAQKLENTDDATRQNGGVKVADLLNGEPEVAEADAVEDDGRSTGLLIANDSDYKRAHLLIHQMKRLNSPNLLVTNHDATVYPSIRLPPLTSADGRTTKNRYLKFDRILADVPCSGDGTTRKNVNLWNDWNPANAIGLFATQARILFRALQMLKVGGRVVYSTCSMNPIENEAVIAHVIDRCGGSSSVEIINCENELPDLKRRPGLTTWTIMDKTGRIYENWGEAEEEVRKLNPAANRLVEGMFPPSKDAEAVDLTRCMRVYPHMQDTGGFFITVLEKKREIKAKPDSTKAATATPQISTPTALSEPDPAEKNGKAEPRAPANQLTAESGQEAATSTLKRGPEHLDEPEAKRPKVVEDTQQEVDKAPEAKEPTEAPPTSTSTAVAPPKPKRRQQNSFEEPFKYLDSNREDLDAIFDYFRLAPQFPRDRFMVRNAEGRPAKTIYYTTVLSREILTENESTGIKFVHCGVKMFVKQDVQKPDVCPWRIQMEGLPVIESWVGMDRVVKMYTKSTLRKLLVEMFPKVNDGAWKELGEIGERVRDMEMGCCILRLETSDKEDGFRERMVFPLWRSAYSVNLMLPKEERRAVLLRLFDDDTPLVNSTQKREAAAKAKEEINVADYDSEPEANGNANGNDETEDIEAEAEAEADTAVDTAGEDAGEDPRIIEEEEEEEEEEVDNGQLFQPESRYIWLHGHQSALDLSTAGQLPVRAFTMAPLQDLYALLQRSSVNDNNEPSSSLTSTFTRIGVDKSLSSRALQPVSKRYQMINIPAIYTGPHTSPPIVVAIVLGTVIGFVAVAYLVYTLVNKPKDIMSASSVVSDEFRRPKRRPPPRRRPTKPGPRKKPIIVDEDIVDEPEPDFVDVQDTSEMHGRYEGTESIQSPYSEESSEAHYHHHGRSRHSPEMAESFYDPHSSRGGRRGR